MSGRFQEIVHFGRLFFLRTKPSLCLKLCKKEIKFYEIESSKFLTSTSFSPHSSFENLLANFKNILRRQVIRPQKVILNLADELIFSHSFTLYNGLTEPEVDELVRLEASTCFSMPLEELFWDYKVQESALHDYETHVLLVAVPIISLLSIIDALKTAGFEIMHLGLSSKPFDFNLLPWRSQNKKKKKVFLARLSLVVLSLIFLSLSLLHSCFSQKIISQKLINRHFEEEIFSLDQTIAYGKRLEERKNRLLKQLHFSQHLQNKRFYMIEVCRTLSQMLPAEIYLKKVWVKNKRIQVVGISPHAKFISLFLDTLKHKVFLTNIELGWVKKMKHKEAHEFQLFFAFRTLLPGYD